MDGLAVQKFADSGEGAGFTPHLNLDGFAGSLDFLLRVARAHQVNLSVLPIVDIVDQLAQALAQSPDKMPLGQKADWVVMVSWIVLLRSNLMLPPEAPEQQEAVNEAVGLRDRLVALQEAQTLAAWLDRRQVLGRDVFARGQEEFPGGFGEIRHAKVDVISFLWAAMELFGDPTDKPDTVKIHRPLAPVYSIPEARLRILRFVAEVTGSKRLDELLPDDIRSALINNQAIPERRRRAAVSTTFIAALELTKQGDVAVEQDAFLAPVRVRALVEINGAEHLQK